VREIRVGERVHRDASAKAANEVHGFADLTHEDRPPPRLELRIVDGDAEGIAQRCEVGALVDLAALVALVVRVEAEAPAQLRGALPRGSRPALEHALPSELH